MRERNVLSCSAVDTHIGTTLEVGVTDERDLETARSRWPWSAQTADTGRAPRRASLTE
jgi:hypothetical protein